MFWVGSQGPIDRGLAQFLLTDPCGLLPVPLFVLSGVDFTTSALSCLTPRLSKYFPKTMSHVWVCAFSRMNHRERGCEPRKRESVSGLGDPWLSCLRVVLCHELPVCPTVPGTALVELCAFPACFPKQAQCCSLGRTSWRRYGEVCAPRGAPVVLDRPAELGAGSAFQVTGRTPA